MQWLGQYMLLIQTTCKMEWYDMMSLLCTYTVCVTTCYINDRPYLVWQSLLIVYKTYLIMGIHKCSHHCLTVYIKKAFSIKCFQWLHSK